MSVLGSGVWAKTIRPLRNSYTSCFKTNTNSKPFMYREPYLVTSCSSFQKFEKKKEIENNGTTSFTL